MLNKARVSEHAGRSGLQLASEHCMLAVLAVLAAGGREGGWCRLGVPLTPVVSPRPNMRLNAWLPVPDGHAGLQRARGMGVGLLGACYGAGKTVW